jgi:Ca2+-transporting ATPase
MVLGSGTDVAKEIADLVLLNDDFSIIVDAVEEGRKILDNIRKIITYLLADSFTETILIGVGIMMGWPLPVSAAQILWVNLIEDGLPDIALAFEPKEQDIMLKPPAKRNDPLLTQEMKTLIFIVGIITDLILLGLFWWFWQKTQDIVYVRTIIFAALAIDSLLFVFACKSLRKNIWQMNIFSNKFLNISVLIGILMLVSAIYFPPFQSLLKTIPIGLYEWSIIIGFGLVDLILIEITKYYFIIKKQAI